MQNGLDGGEMPAITLKNVPNELYEDIKTSASQNMRSINNEIIYRLRTTLSHQKIHPKRLISKIDRLNSRLSLPKLNDKFLFEAKNQGRK